MRSSAVKNFADPWEYQTSIPWILDVRGAFLTQPGEYHAELTRIEMHRLWLQRGETSAAGQ